MKKVDMSSEAITRRLRQASQLRDLSLSLMKARHLTEEEAAELRKRRRAERAEEKENAK
jgi:hypothetical protein